MTDVVTQEQPAQPPLFEPPRPHPVRLVDNDDLRRSRLTVLVRVLLALPHLIWVSLYATVALVVALVNWIVTLIKGESPMRLHRWLVRFLRYTVYVYSYFYVLANPYPPFHGEDRSYTIDLVVEGPGRQRRLVTALRIVLVIPAFVLSWVLGQVLQVLAVLNWLIAIVLGRVPRGMEQLGLYCLRYQTQVYAYLVVVTDRYPSTAGS
ncbi:MAG TPA: DUF4389 domain-containing protein [Gaiellaceae bacterium]|nr:DUF4389 domain-containing protein [Gaiellaceae bacterium]